MGRHKRNPGPLRRKNFFLNETTYEQMQRIGAIMSSTTDTENLRRMIDFADKILARRRSDNTIVLLEEDGTHTLLLIV